MSNFLSKHDGPRAAEGDVQVVVAEGARAAETFLLAQLKALADARHQNPEQLATPVYLVVPSNSLREHLLARIVAAHGAQAGLHVTTLRRLAFEVLRRSGDPVRDGSALLPLLLRRLAARQPALQSVLDNVVDGYASTIGSVNDLLDAGFDAAHSDALGDLLKEEWPGAVGLRAAAVAKLASDVRSELEALGRTPRAGLFSAARRAIEARPDLLAARALWVYGYADVTGTQCDLLETLLRNTPGGIVLDAPPNPADPGRGADAGVAFLDRLRARVEPLGAKVTRAAEPVPALCLFRAPGIQAEVREVAERVAVLLAKGVPAERIGVVARDLGPFVRALRAQFDRVGVPYSGPGSPLMRPEAQRVRALIELLREQGQAALDCWLDAETVFSAEQRRDLRLAFHLMGRVRLEQAATLPLDQVLGDRSTFALPLRQVADVDADDDDAPARAPKRKLNRRTLEVARARAQELEQQLRHWPARAPLEQHLERLRHLLTGPLGWRTKTTGFDEVQRCVSQLPNDVDAAFEVESAELPLLLERALAPVGADPLGGKGGGVAVLNTTEARARCFEHLFVMGLNRDLFPRVVSEDALLPDALRECIERDLLPDIPVKRRGYDEERYLFAQLCSSSPNVTLSYASISDDGRERPPSPFIERVRLARDLGENDVRLAPEWLAVREQALPADEALALVATDDGADASLQRDLFQLALGELHHATDPGAKLPDAAAWADGRVAVMRELDRNLPTGAPGPYFGWVGAATASGDAPVTHLEALARCPWQAFLHRELQLEALPDARAELPSLSPLLLGTLLHRVLEEIVRAAGARANEPLDPKAPGVDVHWPAPEQLAQRLERAATTLLAEQGIHLAGFPQLLVTRVEPFFERVRQSDWPDGVARGVIGVELDGRAAVEGEGGPWTVPFRADRVDRQQDGGLVLTDYKAGKPAFTVVKTAKKLREKLQKSTQQGAMLQAAVYLAGGGARARYLFANPELDMPAELSSDDIETGLRDAFSRHAAPVLLRLRGAGAFVPRLLDEGGAMPRACQWCDVRSACFQPDTGARERLRAWLAAPGDTADPSQRAVLDYWKLGAGS